MSPGDFIRQELMGSLEALRPYAVLKAGSQGADDLLQSVALRALQSADQFTVGTNIKAWLRVILMNEHRDNVRRARYRRVIDLDDVAETYLARPANQETVVLLREVVAVAMRLNPIFLDVIAAGADGRPGEEAAAEIGISSGTFRARLNRARAELKERVNA